jgi:hypothetical protein
MADFCKQCSIDMFGEDFGDLAGVSKPEDTFQHKYAVVICEGCGCIQVDHEGQCVTENCLMSGHKSKVLVVSNPEKETWVKKKFIPDA